MWTPYFPWPVTSQGVFAINTPTILVSVVQLHLFYEEEIKQYREMMIEHVSLFRLASFTGLLLLAPPWTFLRSHTVLEGGKTKKKLTGAGIGAKFWRIISRVTTKNLKIGLWGLFEKKRFLYFHLMARMQIFGSKCSFLALNPFFSEIIHFFWHHHDWTPKRQLFCVDPDARKASG